jgi:hypothetical protein
MIEVGLKHFLIWCLMIFPLSQFYFGQAKEVLELCEHRAKHGPDATLGPYGLYRDWPSKTSGDVVDQGIPGAPTHEETDVEGGLVDPVTGDALAPLRQEELPRDPTADSIAEV